MSTTTRPTPSVGAGGKENNKNTANKKYTNKFVGGNPNLHGKTFEISGKDTVHQFADTVKAIADYVGQE